MKFNSYILVGFLLATLKMYPAFGQNDIQSSETSSGQRFSPSFHFENINKVPYYYDKKAFERLKKLDKQQKWEELFTELREYVGSFGIQNFYRDTYLLWRLAKLTELYGDPDEAIQLYKLALKHHRDDIDINKIELYYDSLKQEDEDLYVPLEYYYELVDYRKDVDTLRPPRGVKLNMGALVNSKMEDYGPTLAAEDEILLFTSKRNVELKGLEKTQNEDLFLSKKWGSFWSEAEPLKDINTQFNEGSATLSRDGKTLYFSRCYSPDSYGSCDIFVAELLADSVWGNIRNLGVNVNSAAWDSHPSLSHTEDTLYFASDRIGGFGLSDIYFTHKIKNGNWAPAQNAGPVVNTRNNEVSPFYHPMHNILYFSSNGQLLNFGEFDIYKSYHFDGDWGDPVNIGPLVNGPGSEFYFTIDAKSRFLFYARSVEDKMADLDLYSFPLPMEAQPLATTKLSGTVMDSLSGNPFKSGIVSIIDLDNGIEVAPKFIREDGTFEFYLINNQNYLLTIQGDQFFRIEELFYLEGDTEIKTYTQPISSKIKFQSIVFDNGKADLKPEMYGDLYKVADFLIDNPDFKLRISGHTDSDGSFDFNMKLSEERAIAIQDFIIHFGNIPASRIEATGFGSTKPIVKENTEEDKSLNRRVEFEIYRPGKNELEHMREEIQEEREEW